VPLCYNTAVRLVIVILTTLYPGLKNTGCVLCCVASAAALRDIPGHAGFLCGKAAVHRKAIKRQTDTLQ